MERTVENSYDTLFEVRATSQTVNSGRYLVCPSWICHTRVCDVGYTPGTASTYKAIMIFVFLICGQTWLTAPAHHPCKSTDTIYIYIYRYRYLRSLTTLSAHGSSKSNLANCIARVPLAAQHVLNKAPITYRRECGTTHPEPKIAGCE